MGTINYKTSDHITIGYDLTNTDHHDEFYNDIIQDCFDQIEYRLKEEYFSYFHITIEPGYYEGFSINIEYNFPLFVDSWEDKRNAQKEITEIKAFLIECVNDFKCCAVSPGWCMTFYDYKDTLKKISAAIREMRDTVKHTPTYSIYNREELRPYL